MPYNNTPIPPKPKEEWDGTSYLPLARVRKIIKLDDEIDACTPAAAFLITIATEMFIQELSKSAHRMTKVEKKPRKNIQYKDLANAVARLDNLDFLSDVIPKTVPFSKVLEKRGGQSAKGSSAFGGDGLITPGKGSSTAVQDSNSDSNSPIANETTRMKDLHLSNQASGSATKKGRKSQKDHDGDLLMQ
ncbi:hypothetical protein ABW19_dt0202594 [Dactylella cylindrospora]|nr:hypothetical protein ABW19_dt0202594 [Dactylella cylindrospora]